MSMKQQHRMPDGSMMAGKMSSMGDSKSMKQHQAESCKECTPKENPQMTAANKPSKHTHPAHNAYSSNK